MFSKNQPEEEENLNTFLAAEGQFWDLLRFSEHILNIPEYTYVGLWPQLRSLPLTFFSNWSI